MMGYMYVCIYEVEVDGCAREKRVTRCSHAMRVVLLCSAWGCKSS